MGRPKVVPVNDALGLKMLSTGEAAIYLGVSPRTMQRWRLECSGPVFSQFGRGRVIVRYRLADLERFAAQSQIKPTPPPGPRFATQRFG